MRKAELAALATVLRVNIAIQVRENRPSAVVALENVARGFAASISADRAAFLSACGIDEPKPARPARLTPALRAVLARRPDVQWGLGMIDAQRDKSPYSWVADRLTRNY